ncbi:MAG: hypothetical protein COB20_11090 [SAR86 cluster bacterium]|uniref:DUF2065 domain-containing protein n=1 Tax=SAR86 cluster bacterium TaxID=2030880 RepID=A0A2A4X0U8_9GAMM|nr:MAG: hypothetical protein COB20_11090 [SAR86 cluster bacterium]
MAESVWISKFLGPIVFILGISMAFSPKELQETTKKFLADTPLILISGVLAMTAGLSIINSHNYWIVDWPLIITLFGWALMLGGALRIMSPGMVNRAGSEMLNRPRLMRVFGVLWGALGAFLVYMGYG